MTSVAPLGYGVFSNEQITSFASEMALSVNNDNLSNVTKKINNTFFGGGPLAPKHFSQILSFSEPHIPFSCFYTRSDNVKIERIFSPFKILGSLEAIPFIGSFIALSNLTICFLAGTIEYISLQNRVTDLQFAIQNQETFNTNELAKSVLRSAIECTQCANKVVGSSIALIPFLKPLVRITQALLYEIAQSSAPQKKTESPPLDIHSYTLAS